MKWFPDIWLKYAHVLICTAETLRQVMSIRQIARQADIMSKRRTCE